MTIHKIPLSRLYSREAMAKLSRPERERNWVAAVLMDRRNFERINLPSTAFSVPRWRYFWQICETIHAAGGVVDGISVMGLLYAARRPPEEVKSWLLEIDHALAAACRAYVDRQQRERAEGGRAGRAQARRSRS